MDADPNGLLRHLRQLAGRHDEGGLKAAADAFTQLDAQLTDGGLLPLAWQPPMAQQAELTIAAQRRAWHRLEVVIDGALRDDERTDKALGPDGQGSLRVHLVRLLSHAVLRELEEEQEQVRAMLTRMAERQTARIMDAVAEAERQPPAPMRVSPHLAASRRFHRREP